MLKETPSLTKIVDERRQEANGKLDTKNKFLHSQFMTPQPIAQFMAALFSDHYSGAVRLLDAGAAVGSLTAAFVKEFCRRKNRIQQISVTAYETDEILAHYLQQTFADCEKVCHQSGLSFKANTFIRDFISDGTAQLFMQTEPPSSFSHAILNPPYKKIGSHSEHRHLLRSIGIETVNLYSAFLAIAIKLLEKGGELVAIIPRSFCNGPYFKSFRQYFLREMALQHIHIFESRTHAFKDDEVLQENIVLHAVKGQSQGPVTLSISKELDFEHVLHRVVNFEQIVKPNDPEVFIHITIDEEDEYLVERMQTLPCTLFDLGIEASTGPVVDFRMRDYLRKSPGIDTFPLIYPAHCRNNFVTWPLSEIRKPNAIEDSEPVQKWLYPNGHYVVVRRFSSKEERRRVVAAVHDPANVPGDKIGFENHVNVFHHKRRGLSPELAKGLAVYLNSTLFDACFRQFNGHTQVNVRDLYNLRYPDRASLEALGKRVVNGVFPNQKEIDDWIEKDLP